jgi:hypothetical protein
METVLSILILLIATIDMITLPLVYRTDERSKYFLVMALYAFMLAALDNAIEALNANVPWYTQSFFLLGLVFMSAFIYTERCKF